MTNIKGGREVLAVAAAGVQAGAEGTLLQPPVIIIIIIMTITIIISSSSSR